MRVCICDFDHTLTAEDTYESLVRKGWPKLEKQTGLTKALQYISKLKGTPISEIIALKDLIIYREKVLNYLDKFDAVYIVSDNPFVRYFVPDEFYDCAFSTIGLEEINGVLTGKINYFTSKVNIVDEIVKRCESNEIVIISDGCSGDGEMLEYLRDMGGSITENVFGEIKVYEAKLPSYPE